MNRLVKHPESASDIKAIEAAYWHMVETSNNEIAVEYANDLNMENYRIPNIKSKTPNASGMKL